MVFSIVFYYLLASFQFTLKGNKKFLLTWGIKSMYHCTYIKRGATDKINLENEKGIKIANICAKGVPNFEAHPSKINF